MSKKQNYAKAFLNTVEIASPCNANWNEMAGDESSRFCAACQKNVYNLSALTSQEAEALILEKEGALCIRYYQREDGTMLTQDCPKGVQALRIKMLKKVSAIAAAFLAFVLFPLSNNSVFANEETTSNINYSSQTQKVTESSSKNVVMGNIAYPAKEKMGEPVLMGKMKVPDKNPPTNKTKRKCGTKKASKN